jgi:hypothetical protein
MFKVELSVGRVKSVLNMFEYFILPLCAIRAAPGMLAACAGHGREQLC